MSRLPESCFASWGDSPSSVDCQLPDGHEGPHRAELEWEEAPPVPALRALEGLAALTAYDLYLVNKYGGPDAVAGVAAILDATDPEHPTGGGRG